MTLVNLRGYHDSCTKFYNKGTIMSMDLDNELIWASANGHIEVVRELIRAGANVHARDDLALRWAFRNEQKEIAKLLFEENPCQD